MGASFGGLSWGWSGRGAGLRAGVGLGEEEGSCPGVEAGSEPRVACSRVQLHPPQALAIATITVHSLFEQRALYFIKAIAYLCSYLTYSKVYVITHFIDEKKEVRRRLHSSRGTNRIQVPPLPCVLNMHVTISGPRKPQTTSVKGL